MPDLWLHVGLPKCGSTTIQRHFAQHDAAHRAHGLLYPATAREADGYRSHRPLARPGADLPALAAGIAREAAAARADRVLVSSEAFSEATGRRRGPQIANALAAALGGRVVVLGWMRHPRDWAESGFAQFVRAGLFGLHRGRFWEDPATADVRRFVAAYEARHGRSMLSPLAQAEAHVAAFAPHEVRLRSLEGPDLDAPGLLADACRLLGVPLLDGPSRRNDRLAPRRVALMVEAQARHGPARFDEALSRFERGPIPNPALRAARLELPPDRHAPLMRALREERPALARLMATRVDALTGERPPPDAPDDWLDAADLARMEAFMAG